MKKILNIRDKTTDKRYKLFLLLFLMIFTVSSLSAAMFPKVGTASLQFLKLGIDARAIGMGEAYTAVSDDISSVYWNPAGLAMKYDKQLFFSHTNWVAETYHEFFAYSMPTDYGFLAVFVSFFNSGEMEETDEWNFGPTGRTFYFYNLAAGVTYANAFTDKFSFGTSAKYLREGIADESINSIAFDVGTRYNTGFRNTTIGMSLRNFGPDTKYSIDPPDDPTYPHDRRPIPNPIPMNFSLGLVTDIMREDNSYLIASAQIDNCVDREETWNLGAEYNTGVLFLRGGYQLNYDAASYSFGVGFKVNTRAAIFNIDYAYTNMGRLQEDFLTGAHRFSVKMSF